MPTGQIPASADPGSLRGGKHGPLSAAQLPRGVGGRNPTPRCGARLPCGLLGGLAWVWALVWGLAGCAPVPVAPTPMPAPPFSHAQAKATPAPPPAAPPKPTPSPATSAPPLVEPLAPAPKPPAEPPAPHRAQDDHAATSNPVPTQVGVASWYGRRFHGRRTASGERFDMHALTAAHRTLPLSSHARVRNPANGREVRVRINDRGPFHGRRVIDLSYAAAAALGLLNRPARVEIFAEADDLQATQPIAAAPPAPPPRRP